MPLPFIHAPPPAPSLLLLAGTLLQGLCLLRAKQVLALSSQDPSKGPEQDALSPTRGVASPSKPCTTLPCTTGGGDSFAEHAVATPHLSLLGLVALGALAFGIGLAWAYVKKPRKTPVMLTSLLDLHSHERPRNENLPRLPGMKEVVLRLERDPIHPLYSLHLEDLHLHTGSDGHEGMEVLPTPLEKGCWLPGWAAEGSGLKRTILDTSRGSIDSGVCLQDPTDHLGLFLGSRKLSLGSHKGSGSFQGDPGGLWLEEQLLPVAPIAEERLLLQSWPSRSQGQPREASEGEGCSTLSSGLGGAACSAVGLATGYLKQASLEPPSARGMAAPARDFTDTTNSCASPPA